MIDVLASREYLGKSEFQTPFEQLKTLAEINDRRRVQMELHHLDTDRLFIPSTTSLRDWRLLLGYSDDSIVDVDTTDQTPPVAPSSSSSLEQSSLIFEHTKEMSQFLSSPLSPTLAVLLSDTVRTYRDTCAQTLRGMLPESDLYRDMIERCGGVIMAPSQNSLRSPRPAASLSGGEEIAFVIESVTSTIPPPAAVASQTLVNDSLPHRPLATTEDLVEAVARTLNDSTVSPDAVLRIDGRSNDSATASASSPDVNPLMPSVTAGTVRGADTDVSDRGTDRDENGAESRKGWKVYGDRDMGPGSDPEAPPGTQTAPEGKRKAPVGVSVSDGSDPSMKCTQTIGYPDTYLYLPLNRPGVGSSL